MSKEVPAEQKHPPILFYDGECGFCNATIQYILRHEHTSVLLFAPLQGTTAEKMLAAANLPADIAEKSIVVYDGNSHFIRAKAVARVLNYMGGAWPFLSSLLDIIPSALSDGAYRLIARYRKHLPQAESCQSLSPDQRSRFLP